jgi:branched-chain amino acid aminotransferase
MGTIVSIDGELMAPERATVSVFDQGFLHGDSVYEVLRTYRGAPFELEAHLARLQGSADRIGLSLPMPLDRIAAEVRRTIDASGNAESRARIIATRGVEQGPDLPQIPDGRLIVIARPLVTPPLEAYEHGVKLALVGVRRDPGEAVDPMAKTGNRLNNVLAMKRARQQGAFEALMLDRDGRVTEATTANVFLVKDGELRTPPLAVGILEGVTRRVVLAVAAQVGVPAREAQMTPADLFAADELFITSTTRELVPVVTVAEGEVEHRIGSGKPGPITLKLLAAFRARALAQVARG